MFLCPTHNIAFSSVPGSGDENCYECEIKKEGKTMRYYACGFLFTEGQNYNRVALIRKDHPEWQAGKLNGVGGLMEPRDYGYAAAAMQRKFNEEAGLDVPRWGHFCTLKFPDTTIYFYRANWATQALLNSKISEPVEWYDVKHLGERRDMIPDLKWLIPMALDEPRRYPYRVEALG